MITLLDLSVYSHARDGEPRVVLDNLTLHFPMYERIGILAASGSGKTALAGILSGMFPPTKGHIVFDGKVSPPIGYGQALHPELTVMENIAIHCRANGDDASEAVILCASLGRLGDVIQRRIKELTNKQRRALAFCLSLSGLNDVYIADDTIVFGDQDQQKEAVDVLNARLDSAGLIFISSNKTQLGKFCDRFFLLKDCRIAECADLEEAAAELEREYQPKPRQASFSDDTSRQSKARWFLKNAK